MAYFQSIEGLRLSVFVGLLIILIISEALFPRKNRTQKRYRRWGANFGILVLGSLVIRLMGPFVAVSAAFYAQQHGWGALNLIILPDWAAFVIALLVLDMAIYLQHVISHRIPLFWRFHKVHHADRDIDVTTALRFHPLEIAGSMLYKIVWVFILGPSVMAVILFEIILNGMAMFNHANLRLPLGLDRVLRSLIVTPDMHRVHHSVLPEETHSNFGFNLSVWDRMFGTYIAQPRDGHDGMTIGLAEYQTQAPNQLFWALRLPFIR